MKGITCISSFILSCLMLFCGISNAAVVNVPTDYPTIQQAINAASYGDEVVVAAGVYNESITMKDGVDLTGAGSSNTVIQSTGTVVRAANACKISGFKLSGYNTGIQCLNVTAFQILDNVIDPLPEAGSRSSVLGVYLNNCTEIVIDNNTIGNLQENAWGYAAGIFINSSSDVTALKNIIYNIHENLWSGAYGIYVYEGARVELLNNLIYHIVESEWDNAYGIYCRGLSHVILNNVIKYAHGTAWGGAIGIYTFGASHKISNNIVEEVYNTSGWPGGTFGVYDAGTSNEISYNNVWRVTPPYYGQNEPISGPGNLNVDPLFVGTEDPWIPGYYILQAGSPCIDAGDPDPAYNDPDGTRNDMGIFGGTYTYVPPTHAEVAAFKYSTAARPGFDMSYSVIVGNMGEKHAKNVVLTDNLPPEVTYISSAPAGTYDAVAHSVEWDIGTFTGETHQTFTISANVPATTDLGTQLVNEAIVATTAPKDDPLNNRSVCVTTVIGSWDPNDKGVSPQGYIAPEELLTYFVHFENEGTASAINISITDVLDMNLDDETLLLISDEGEYNEATRTITWTFENINLPPGGEGMVSFLTMAKPELTPGTEIKNKASIVFDFNPPIDTPEVVSIIGTEQELSMQGLINAMYLIRRDMQMTDIPNQWGFVAKVDAATRKVFAAVDYLHGGEIILGYNMLNVAKNEINALTDMILDQIGQQLPQEVGEKWLIMAEAMIDVLQPMIDETEKNLPVVSGINQQVYRDHLGQNYPNPFNPSTTIKYSIKERANVTLKVYNVAGQLVKTLVDEEQIPRSDGFTVRWNGRSNSGNPVSSGVYFYRLVTKGFTQTKKLIVLK